MSTGNLASPPVPEAVVQALVDDYKRAAALHNAQAEQSWAELWKRTYDARAQGFQAIDPPQEFWLQVNESVVRSVEQMTGDIPKLDPYFHIPIPVPPKPEPPHPAIVIDPSAPQPRPGFYEAIGDNSMPSSPNYVSAGTIGHDNAGRAYRKRVFGVTFGGIEFTGWEPI